MRTIKFRAWDGKEMWTGFNILPTDIIVPPAWKKSKEILEYMQFTGLLDKNGVEIYEGDVMKGYLPSSTIEPIEVILTVSFEEGSFIVTKLNEEPMTLRDFIKLSNKRTCNFLGIEKIGNIYENSNLLTA